MTKEKEKDKKVAKEQLLLEASRLGQLEQLETVLSQLQQLKSRKKTNPLASLRKSVGPNSIRDPVTGFTCLHHAALNGHGQCVQLILDYGAKLNALDYKGSSPLHLAAWAGNLEVVRILLSRRQPASPNELLATQQSPGNNNHHHNKQQRVDLNLCNNDNQTPLSLAAQFGHHQVVAELLASGANVHLRNNRLESPLELACLNGRLETVELLLDSSAALVADLRRPRASLPLAQHQVDGITTQQVDSRPASISGSDLWSSPAAQPGGGHARRPSGSGWTSFLRGRRDSTGGSSVSATSGSNNQSPLHRLTSGTLSMRGQKSPASQQASLDQQVELAAAATSAEGRGDLQRRRATLTVGTTLSARELAKQMSLELDRTSEQVQSGVSSSLVSEKLLDHSPLHYATRKGHVNVVNLLLYKYQANILQVTSMGSVLHEIALNNGKNSEMIGLFFNFIAEQQQQQQQQQQQKQPNAAQVDSNRLQQLNSFLCLLNEQQRSVFEVLNEINNRSAQEIKRLIYEYSDQIQQQQQQQQQQQIARPQTIPTTPAAANLLEIEQQQQQVQVQQRLNTQPACDYSSQELRESQQQPQAQQAMRFSDIHHFNSFVTMKRVPKNQQQQQLLTGAGSAGQQRQVNQVAQLQVGSTQTVDRRASVRRHDFQQQQQASCEQQSRQPTNFQQVSYQSAFGANNAHLPGIEQSAISRSVSNLSRASIKQYSNDSQSQHDPTHLMWQQWLARGNNYLPQQQQQQHDHHHRQAQQLSNGTYLSSGNATRNHYEQQHQQDSSCSRGRSKSRDLGSLLIEAHQLEATQQPPDQHHLYDNNAQVSRTSAGMVEAPHLVRSQTDCSHLMGRFFGDQKSAAYLSSDDRQQQQQADDQQQQPSNANSERRMINRHYHVYDHQFYPPRLLPTTTATNQREQKPTVGNLLRNESGQLRSSVRSTASSQSSNRYQHLISQRQQQHQQLHQRQPASDLLSSSSSLSQQPLRNNSRLSLNIDPQTARQADGLTCEQQQQQHQSSSQQANNMDRFLARHSRKVQQEQQVAGAQQVVSAEQKRQALVELQRRLLAESLGQQHQQQLQQHIHSSYSLESHLSEPHLFESTRRALMKDFDKMIGQELLNRNHRPIIDGGLQQAAAGTRSVNGTTTDSCRLPTAQQPSILTGVMLDMDRYGERLTVSGTRVTRKSSSADISRSHPRNLSTNGTLKSTQNSDEDTNSNSGGSSSNNSNSSVSRPPPPVASPGSSLSTSSAPLTSYATSREPPPPKPPRPSLLTRANTSQQQHQRPGIIYDLPATAPTSSTDVRSVNHLDQTSRTSSGRQVFSRSQTLNQTVVAQVAPVATKLSRVSHTEPPKVRPPPPPASKALTSPLHVLPPNLSEVASTGAASSSNSSTGSGEIGLLKMAAAATSSIGARSPGQRRVPPPPPTNLALTLNSSTQLTDPDSGVCTSNSPASLSHDSESGGIAAPGSCEPEVTASSVISKRTRSNDESVHQQQLDCIMPASATEVANHHVDSPARAPPSPKTAQLCIEEALLPLAMVHKTATDQTTSPLLTSGSARQSANAVDRWLVTDNPLQQQQQLTLEKPPEADYENCRSLQEQLQHASCKTVGQLLTTEVSPMDSLDRVDCCDDADYAESSSDNNSALSSSELSRGSVDELCNGGRAPEHHQQPAVSPDKVAAVTEILDGKEVLLKVVIDKSEKAANGDEVFYINPLELKRLAAKQSQHQLDSGTLTDEELCAAIDKNSGYIRFTLRKRRNNGSGDEQNLPTVSDKSLMIVDGEQEQPVASSCSKRTKFNSNHEQQVETKEVSCGADQDQAGVKSVINANVCADLSPTATTTSTKDRQEIDSSAILRQIHKQGALRLSQWFTTNLTGLAEYQTAFLHNGLDNMQFLNHKKILNDETLKQIGIDNESHRLLIVERVSKELPQANFEHILSSLSPKAGKVSLVKVLEFLQLEHLSNNDQSVFAKDEQLHLDCLNSVRDKLVNLPLGHRLRLSAALDFLEAEKLKANETEQQGAAGEQQPPPPLCKQVSSESSEVEMEASQASATSSSSSKESIKSMVLMKMDHQSNDSEGEQQQPLQQVTKEDVKMPTMTINRLTDENKENNKSEDMINRVKKTVSPPMQVDRRQPFSVSAAAKTAGRSCSLVSEAARKLEAAAAAASINQKNQPAKSGPPPPKPVAAVRKINNNRLADCSSRDSSSDSLQQQPVAAAVNPTSKVSKSTTTTTKTTATNGVVEGKVSSLNSSKRSSPKTTATHFVPVKSICWPPKSTQQESRQSTCEIAPTVNKLQSVKSTYQKLLEEKSKSDYNNGGSTDDQQTQQQQQQVVAAVAGKLKPKPAPPAKPAKLAASKFNVDFSHKL